MDIRAILVVPAVLEMDGVATQQITALYQTAASPRMEHAMLRPTAQVAEVLVPQAQAQMVSVDLDSAPVPQMNVVRLLDSVELLKNTAQRQTVNSTTDQLAMPTRYPLEQTHPQFQEMHWVQ